uniref:C-type lectin domain-containing protein n=1 Tax=Astatotilapia calliptera TaxID=8154 RepID=A0AAX7TL21_ASTCA
MFKLVLLLLALSGLQAVPIKTPRGLKKSSSDVHQFLPDGFRQADADVPVQRSGGSWVRVENPSHLPDGFRQGTEPSMKVRDGFRQGTEPFMKLQDGFRQGTEPFMKLRDGFRQGTEPFLPLQRGFRQGTEPFMKLRDGFRQGTEPFMKLRDGFRQGTEPFLPLQRGFRQGTEPFYSFIQRAKVACQGEIINNKCYEFNPTPLSFKDAQAKCRTLAPHAELASVTSGDLHSHLISLVTMGGKKSPVLTWLGATVTNQEASWVDGSEWGFSDWMPGHPNIHTDKPVCVEMFELDNSRWTTANCDLKRASICTYMIPT